MMSSGANSQEANVQVQLAQTIRDLEAWSINFKEFRNHINAPGVASIEHMIEVRNDFLKLSLVSASLAHELFGSVDKS